MVKKANDAGVVLLSFDNVIDDPNNIEINVDQEGIGKAQGEFLLKQTKADPANFLFVRGPAGQPGGYRPRQGLSRASSRPRAARST